MAYKIEKFADAEIGFKNFEGREGTYNTAGNRNFVIFLDDARAKQLERDGWNVKWPKAKPNPEDEEDTRQPFLKVAVVFKNYPPNVQMITEAVDPETKELVKIFTRLEEDTVFNLDKDRIIHADVVVTGSSYDFLGKQGVKAYLKSGYFEIETDDFYKKYGV